MTASPITVWLPDARLAALMGGLPDGLTADVWDGGEQVPASAAARASGFFPWVVSTKEAAPAAALECSAR
jgi:hypothetical protein